MIGFGAPPWWEVCKRTSSGGWGCLLLPAGKAALDAGSTSVNITYSADTDLLSFSFFLFFADNG